LAINPNSVQISETRERGAAAEQRLDVIRPQHQCLVELLQSLFGAVELRQSQP
jgi:hypothetical protein